MPALWCEWFLVLCGSTPCLRISTEARQPQRGALHQLNLLAARERCRTICWSSSWVKTMAWWVWGKDKKTPFYNPNFSLCHIKKQSLYMFVISPRFQSLRGACLMDEQPRGEWTDPPPPLVFSLSISRKWCQAGVSYHMAAWVL